MLLFPWQPLGQRVDACTAISCAGVPEVSEVSADPLERPRARPEASRRTGGRGVSRSLLVSDERCKERQRGDAPQQAIIITSVSIKSSLKLLSSTSFSRLSGLRRGVPMAGRPGD